VLIFRPLATAKSHFAYRLFYKHILAYRNTQVNNLKKKSAAANKQRSAFCFGIRIIRT
jgi:hypothetical protein